MVHKNSTWGASTVLIAGLTVAQLCLAGEVEIDTSSKWWIDGNARRPPLFIWNFSGPDCDYKSRVSGYGGPLCPEEWSAYLKARKLEPLEAPPGGRAYRWFWDGEMSQGFVQLSASHDGSGMMITSAAIAAPPVGVADVSRFETALAHSEFPNAVPDTGSVGFDACQDTILEAVVDGKYRFVRYPCGFPQTIYDVLHPIEFIAGFGPPASDHCFFLPPDCLAQPPKPPAASHD
jgi:hypothetical protein